MEDLQNHFEQLKQIYYEEVKVKQENKQLQDETILLCNKLTEFYYQVKTITPFYAYFTEHYLESHLSEYDQDTINQVFYALMFHYTNFFMLNSSKFVELLVRNILDTHYQYRNFTVYYLIKIYLKQVDNFNDSFIYQHFNVEMNLQKI